MPVGGGGGSIPLGADMLTLGQRCMNNFVSSDKEFHPYCFMSLRPV